MFSLEIANSASREIERSRNLSWRGFGALDSKYLIAIAMRGGNVSSNGINFFNFLQNSLKDSKSVLDKWYLSPCGRAEKPPLTIVLPLGK